MPEFKVIGKGVPRSDSIAKVTGTAKYTADISWPRMLHGAILRSPHPHAQITGIDCRKALALPGVRSVVTADDTPKKKYGGFIADEYPLAVDRVRFFGDEVAAVAAADRETAEKALALIEVQYEILPAVYDVFDALKPDAPLVDDVVGKNLAYKYSIHRGDIESGFNASACVVEDTFQLPTVCHGCIELTTCAAVPESRESMVIWAPTSAPFMLRNQVGATLGIPTAQIRVIQAAVGGSFGSRHTIKAAIIVTLLARKTGRPVTLSLEREEEFLTSRPRMAAEIRLRMGFAADGTILAKKTDITANNGAYTATAPLLLETTARRADNLYRIKNIETDVRLVYTNRASSSAFRGFGNPQMHFAIESMMDMAADRLGLDPVQIRLKNATQKGDITAHGWKITSCDLTKCIDTVTRAVDWDGRGPARKFVPSGRKRHGLGMACMIHIAGRRKPTGFSGSNAQIKFLDSGKVVIYSGEADVGQGCSDVFRQIAAETLEVPLETVETATLDTLHCPFGLGSFSDRVTITGGNAVRMAALDVRKQIMAIAAAHFESPEDILTCENGVIRCLESGQTIDMVKLVRQTITDGGGMPLIGQGNYWPPFEEYDTKTKYGNLGVAYTFAAQAAEVEVDLDTGHVKVLNFKSAHDLGRTLNPLTASGQVEGALAQGLGYALMEEMHFEPHQTQDLSFLEYKMPTMMDVPSSEVFLIESIEPNGPFGAKGVAEPGLVPTAPAIANAIFHATGARITSLPITPQKVLDALAKLAD
ncbi:MAG: xanthine dehydrogenase family protein molybdopterin-binding subunit [Desulfobacterales bacterium]|nr:xanthine dehydrogenase family protein molybdopterin-binding subunit [Desulfobacterales bacterium]